MSSSARTLSTRSEAETEQVGARVGASLRPGDVILLSGELGAGKTAFVRGLAAGLGIDPGEVSSPTFTLIQEYRGVRTLIHVDLYRLTGRDVDDLGLEEMTADGACMAIEWADRLPRPWPGAMAIHLAHAGEAERQITIMPPVKRPGPDHPAT